MTSPILSGNRASNLFRRALCQGSAHAEAGLPEITSEDAVEGKLLHRVTFGQATQEERDSLTEEQSSAVFRTVAHADALKRQVFGDALNETTVRIVEGEFVSEELEISGHPDEVIVHGKSVLILDAKYGRDPVERAEANYQLRAYAALLSEVYMAEKFYCAIIQPRVEKERQVTLCEYSWKEIQEAKREIAGILAAAENPNATRTPSIDACRYCRAKGTERCPETQGVVLAVSRFGQGLLEPVDLPKMLDACEIAEKVIEAVKARAKEVLVSGEEIPGWTLKEGNKVRVISDPTKAYQALAGHVPAEVFAGCCTVKVGQLETAFKKATALKGKAAVEAFEMKLGEAMALKQNSPTLARAEAA